MVFYSFSECWLMKLVILYYSDYYVFSVKHAWKISIVTPLISVSLLISFRCGLTLSFPFPKVVELFSNITWTKEEHTVHEFEVVENWRTPWTGIFVNLILYITFTVSIVFRKNFHVIIKYGDWLISHLLM